MRARISAFLVAFALAVTGLAGAQETTGTISGRIVDTQGLPVPGVTVTATGPQGSRSSVSDTDGRYNIPFATPGVYSVKAELQGFKTATQNNVTVSLGQTAAVNLSMQVGGVTETVEVQATSPVVDTRSTTTGAVLDADQLNTIPVGRRVSDALYVAPGVSTGGSVGSANPSISGASGLENQYVIDGVNVTNQGYGAYGSYSIVFGSLGNATPYDFVKEVQVKTGGYEAEFGQSTGGVVNVVTKSGSNQFRGSAFGYDRPAKVEGTWTPVTSPNGTINIAGTHASDAGLEGGGPIVKDHLFFFGAIDQGWDTRTSLVPNGFPLATVYPNGLDRERRSLTYAAKVGYQLSNAHRIDASFFGDPSKGLNGPQRGSALLGTDTSSFSSMTYGGHNQTVRYDGVLSSKFLLEGYWARALNDIVETPSVDSWFVRDRTVVPNVVSGGIGFYEKGNHSLNNQWVAKATNVFSGNELRYGVEYDDVTYSNINQRTGPTFTAPNGQQTATGAQIDIIPDVTYGRIYRVTRANFNVARVTTQKYTSFFVQDNWRIGTKLTVNPGIRYEQEKMAGTIIQDFMLKNNWAPRLGATYDPSGTGRSKIYGNFGIFYARVPNDLAARALSSDNSTSRADYFDAALTRPVPQGVVTQSPGATAVTNHFVLAGVGADTIDPAAKLSYVREFVLGYEHEVAPNTTAGIRWIDRRIPRVLEDVANCPMAAYDFSAGSAAICGSVEYILTNPTSSTPINPALVAAYPQFGSVKFDDPIHKYDALELTLNRRLVNNWSMIASYRYSKLRGNFEGFFRDDNGQSDPGISSLYDFPTNDPTYAPFYGGGPDSGNIQYLGQVGPLPLDRPHQIKVFGSYDVRGLNLGVGLNLSSGKPLTEFAPSPNYGNGGEIPVTARGAGFTTVDGFKTRAPFYSQVDFQAAYNFNIGGARRIGLVADMFNLFNQQTVLDYDNWTQLSYGAGPNPNFGLRTSSLFAGNPAMYQTPRQIRVGARFQW